MVAVEGPGLGSWRSGGVRTSPLKGPPPPAPAWCPVTLLVAFLTIPRGPCSWGWTVQVRFWGEGEAADTRCPQRSAFPVAASSSWRSSRRGPQRGWCAHLRRSREGSTAGLKRPGEAGQGRDWGPSRDFHQIAYRKSILHLKNKLDFLRTILDSHKNREDNAEICRVPVSLLLPYVRTVYLSQLRTGIDALLLTEVRSFYRLPLFIPNVPFAQDPIQDTHLQPLLRKPLQAVKWDCFPSDQTLGLKVQTGLVALGACVRGLLLQYRRSGCSRDPSSSSVCLDGVWLARDFIAPSFPCWWREGPGVGQTGSGDPRIAW